MAQPDFDTDFEEIQMDEALAGTNAELYRLVSRDQVERLLQQLRAPQEGSAEDPQTRWQMQETAAMQIANRCQITSVGREFKDELHRQGVVQELVACVCQSDEHVPITVKDALLRALAESVYDHPGNAEVAARCGVLTMAGETLTRVMASDYLTENLLCVTNNVIGMSQTTHTLLRESKIVPSLVRLARSRGRQARDGGDIATAALANLSNNPLMRGELISAGAVDALAEELLLYPPEAASGMQDEALPSISYMQSLSAVVKVVGGDSMMGKASMLSAANARPFVIDGSNTTRSYDPGSTVSMVLDRRSVKWMVEYLRASIHRQPYPPDTNIYGTPWKVALSVACIARGSRQNRELLINHRAVQLLEKALLQQVRREEGEQALTERHVVLALRALLSREKGERRSAEYEGGTILTDRTLGKLNRIAAGYDANMDMDVRQSAADVVLLCGQDWNVERLLWAAALKESHVCLLAGLQPSMIRIIMRHFVMLGGI